MQSVTIDDLIKNVQEMQEQPSQLELKKRYNELLGRLQKAEIYFANTKLSEDDPKYIKAEKELYKIIEELRVLYNKIEEKPKNVLEGYPL